MKKKITLIAAAVTLAGAAVVGSTLAWFTDATEVTNVVTFGNVDISINELPTIETITPNETLDSDDGMTQVITVASTSQSCYIRAKFDITGPVSDDISTPDVDETVTLPETAFNIDTETAVTPEYWKLQADGYYYYGHDDNGSFVGTIMSPSSTATFFDTIVIPSAWGNEVANKEIGVKVIAEAIQSDNFDGTWPTDAVEAYNG